MTNEAAEDQISDMPLSDRALVDELSHLHNVPLAFSAELGRLTLRVKEILSLTVGTVLELEKLAGEPLEIVVNDKLICRGEVIVINDKYGVRLTDIVSPHEDFNYKAKNSNQS